MTDTLLINTNLNLFISIYQKSDRKKSRLDYTAMNYLQQKFNSFNRKVQ